jgi:Notch-like protein
VHLSDVLKFFPNKSSLDADGISLKLLKYVAIEVSTPLAHIFNLSLENGIFPARLKNSRTVPIFKSGDQTNCDNYRPISLISTFSKILEKMVAIKLTNHLQLNKLL